jgi:outer membrane protein assembly factor BamB
MFKHEFILKLGLVSMALGCANPTPTPEVAPAAPPPSSIAPAAIEVSKSPAEPPPPPAPKVEKPAAPTPVFRITAGIATPESVLYDEANDRYLVSNINGSPDGVDGNGYITEVSPEGKVVKEKFIAGGVAKAKLDAPKGTGISGGVLYVADISFVRLFDLKTGAPKGEVNFPGATFLNDIAVAKDGRVFVSDSGIKAGPGGFEPTGTDAVYVIEKGKPKAIARSKDLAGPNGLLVVDHGVLVVTFNGDELYRLDEKGVKRDITPVPEGGLDGIIQVGDALYISSWKGSAIYRGSLGGKFELAFSELKGAADIGFDSKRKRVLVPRFLENALEVYDLK